MTIKNGKKGKKLIVRGFKLIINLCNHQLISVKNEVRHLPYGLYFIYLQNPTIDFEIFPWHQKHFYKQKESIRNGTLSKC